MTNIWRLLLFATVAITHAVTAREGMRLSVNPIRRVIQMLQMMKKKVDAEGEKEEQLHEKYMCFCRSGGENYQAGIQENGAKAPQLQSTVDELTATRKQLQSDIVTHKNTREAAEKAMDEAKELRKKAATAFEATSDEAKADIDAMAKAIVALEKGVAGGFLQTSTGSRLRKFVNTDDFQSLDLNDADRDEVTAFLQDGEAPAGGTMEISGILRQMKETMEKALVDLEAKETAAIKDFKSLVAAKEEEADANTGMIEEKSSRLGEVNVDIVNAEQDLEDTKKQLAEDTKFLADLKAGCDSAVRDWDKVKATRAQEIVAITETIKILNDDDALDLFKKTLPSPSFLQTMVSSKEMIAEAQEVVREAKKKHLSKRGHVHLDLIGMALHGKKVSFQKVMKMIDDMVAQLGVEQKADDDKKTQCKEDLDEADDEKKALERDISQVSKLLEEQKSTVESLEDEIRNLEKDIKTLDAEVADRTQQRKINHDEFVGEFAASNAAVQLLELAKNRMNKFYNPKMYKAPPKRELSEEERITLNMGGTLAPTAAPGGIAGTGVTALNQEDDDDDDDDTSFLQVSSSARRSAQPPMPEATLKAYRAKDDESSGVLSMLDSIIKDLEIEIADMKMDENNYQKFYEVFVSDAASQRTEDAKYLTEKAAQKADLEVIVERNKRALKARNLEAMNNDKLIMDIHSECDWLLENMAVRQEARTAEIESLKKAKAVLSGADYSLVQMSSTRHLRRVKSH